MTILVDIDSTITNFSEKLLETVNKYYQTNYTYNEIVSYNWFDQTFEDPWWYTYYQTFWDEVQVNPEAISVLERWVKQGHKIYLVTASHFNNTLVYKIQKTLEPFNPELINERNVVVAQDKSIVMGDVMIDDCIDNLYAFDKVRICYAQPWNEDYPGYLRYNDWTKINDVIQIYTKCPW